MKENILNYYKTVNEFYCEKLQSIASFDDVPFIDKSDLIDSQLKYPPYGCYTSEKKTICQVYRTSGTTANPLLVTFTDNDIDLITTIGADCFRHVHMGDQGSDEVVINCLNLSLWAGGFLDSQAMHKTGVQVVNFGTGNTTELIRLIVSMTKKYHVSIHCTPSYLPIIENRLREIFQMAAAQLGLHALYLGAEGGVQNNSFRSRLKETWNCHVYNANYGMSEVCSIMASAAEDNILKFSNLLNHYYFIELLDKSYNLKTFSELESGDEGTLIFTSLKKESQPLLRYNTKEKIQIKHLNEKGVYFEVMGRNDDMLVYKGINFFPEQLRHIIITFPELSGLYRVQVKKDDLVINSINVICEVKNSSLLDDDMLKNAIIRKIRNELTIKVEMVFTTKIEYNGNKLKMVEFI